MNAVSMLVAQLGGDEKVGEACGVRPHVVKYSWPKSGVIPSVHLAAIEELGASCGVQIDRQIFARRSRAERLSKGRIYIVRAGAGGPVKIGWHVNRKRMNTLQTSHYEELIVLREIEGTVYHEKWLHDFFDKNRIRGEWFTYSEDMLTVTPPNEVPAKAKMDSIRKPCVRNMRENRFEMLIPRELLERVDAWRLRQVVPPTRAAAMRWMIERSLADEEKALRG